MVLSPSTYQIIRDSLKLALREINEDAFINDIDYHALELISKKKYLNRVSLLRKRKQKVVNAIINVKALQKFYD